MPVFSIRKACPGDAEALQELYLHHLTAYPPKESQDVRQWIGLLTEIEKDPQYYLLVGVWNGRVVSSVSLIIIKNLTHNLRPYAVVENVVTHENFRNSGFASALLGRAGEIACENGCYKIMLMTGSKRESTLRFYERNGFDRNEKTAFIKRFE